MRDKTSFCAVGVVVALALAPRGAVLRAQEEEVEPTPVMTRPVAVEGVPDQEMVVKTVDIHHCLWKPH